MGGELKVGRCRGQRVFADTNGQSADNSSVRWQIEKHYRISTDVVLTEPSGSMAGTGDRRLRVRKGTPKRTSSPGHKRAGVEGGAKPIPEHPRSWEGLSQPGISEAAAITTQQKSNENLGVEAAAPRAAPPSPLDGVTQIGPRCTGGGSPASRSAPPSAVHQKQEAGSSALTWHCALWMFVGVSWLTPALHVRPGGTVVQILRCEN